MIRNERLLDLMTARATEGLPDSEQRELDGLLARQVDLSADDFDLAAAEIDEAFASVEPRDEMPESLRSRILATAHDHADREPVDVPRQSRLSGLWWSGWAAAASIVVLMILTSWRTPLDVAGPAPGPAERRAQLIATGSDVVRVDWAPPETPGYESVRGDVVWSNAEQSGYMRLEGLPANVPDKAQYQLWIVDPMRDANPIDGGVFDIEEDGAVIVPIDAKLVVCDPKAFAITLEQPGGVVVSDRPLLVVAPVSS